MDKSESGFPSHHDLPEYMKEKLIMKEKQQSCAPNPNKHPKRAFFHDYCSPGLYMITATTLPGAPVLSSIPDIPPERFREYSMIIPDLSPAGELVKREILDITAHHPEIKILRFVIMPDHIHIVIQVLERLNRMLGKELAGFFGACSAAVRKLPGQENVKTLFQRFHDRIIMDSRQADRTVRYVEENPRRYLIRRRHPDLFHRYLHLLVGNREYAAYGNIFLLRRRICSP